MKAVTVSKLFTFLAFAALIRCSGGQMIDHSPTKRYLALGDSYTIGELVAESERWPVQLAQRLGDSGFSIGTPEIIAKTGWTTDELDAAITERDPRGPYDLVTLLIGVNNQYRGRSADEYRTQFRALLDRAIGFAGGDTRRVIVVSIPDWGITPFAATHNRDAVTVGREIDSYNAINREESERRGVAWVDVTAISREAKTNSSLLAEDELHPSAAMYTRWTEVILPVAKRALMNR